MLARDDCLVLVVSGCNVFCSFRVSLLPKSRVGGRIGVVDVLIGGGTGVSAGGLMGTVVVVVGVAGDEAVAAAPVAGAGVGAGVEPGVEVGAGTDAGN